MAILEVHNIEKHFGPPRVLEDISFDLEQGQALAMLRQDVYAAHLRQGAEALRYQTAVRNEYTQPLCIL